MFETTSFIEQALSGSILNVDEAVEDAIDEWHDRNGVGRTGEASTLADWLGMTEDEYALFVEQPSALKEILMAHRYHLSVRELLELARSGSTKIAARSAPEHYDTLLKWLKETGRL